ncbi:MAG: extracellular solute-binding protein [Kibdelosporangium sp.]
MRLRAGNWVVPSVLGAVVGVLLTLLVVWQWPETPDDGLEQGPLVIVTGADDSAGKWRHTLRDIWNAEHPDNQVKFVELQQAADGQRSQMVAQAGANPDIDVYNLDVTLIAEFAERSYITPLDQSRLPAGFLAGFLRKPLETCHYGDDGDTLWALPLNTDAGLLFYRNDLVPEPPKVWDNVIGTARQNPAPPATAGYVGQLGDYEGLTVNALEAVWAEGGEVVVNNKVVATQDSLSRGIGRLMAGNVENRGITHPGARSFDEATSREAFARGEALFMRNWPVQYSALLNKDTADLSRPQRVPFKVAALPGSAYRVPGPSALGGQNLAVASGSKRKRAAQAFIEFMTQESSQLLLARYGGFAPTRKAPYNDEAVRAQYPYITALEDAVEHAKLRPVTPHYAHFSATFRRIVHQTMDDGGKVPPDYVEVLTRAMGGR